MPVACPFCRKRALELPESSGRVHCVCRNRPIHYVRFPAYERVEGAVMAASAEPEADASCLHHPGKKAEAVCADCGIFMCGLCATEDRGDTVCLSCYAKRQKKELKTNDSAVSARSVQYDHIALAVAVLPLLMWYITFLTAPVALYLVVRHWKDHPYGAVPRSRLGMVVAALFALAELVGWGVFATVVILEVF